MPSKFSFLLTTLNLKGMQWILFFSILFWIIFSPHVAQGFNYPLSQPQIYINDGNLYIIPAENRDLVLVSNGTGKILFNTVELKSLVSSIDNSTRDLNSFKRIFGVPTNSSSAFSTRISHLEQSFRRLDQIDGLDSRLIAVERQLAYNLSSSTEIGGDGRGGTLSGRFRRLRQRIEALENRMRNMGTSDRNPCRNSVCRNGGTCIPTMYGAFCWCAPGWEGDRCQRDQDECTLYRGSDLGCQNGATCVNTPGSYRCDCRSGWMGIHCTKRSGDCSSGPPWELCGHGMCMNQHAGSRAFVCICDQGWKTDGTNVACTVDVDECNGPHASCSKNPVVSCINTPGSFHCGPCPQGYTGNGYYCTDINECLVNNGGCSINPMVQCINTIGSRTCGECPAGYIGNGISCQYVGMCQINNGGCHPMARCVQNPVIGQSFVQCICPAGYTGTGLGLHGCFAYSPVPGTDITPSPGLTTNPCSTNPCVHGTCLAVGNSFICSCLPGYRGPTCGIRIDPCMNNPCNNGGTCISTLSGFLCRCANDFTGDLCELQEESCGGTLATTEGSLTYPHSSSESYNHNQECVWIMQTTQGKALNITFTSFHLEGSSLCTLDFLEIYDGTSGDSPLLGRFCGTELPRGGTFNSTHSSLRLRFKSDGSIAGLGFTLNWNTTDPYCGGLIKDSTHGAISSPGYPGAYPIRRDCYWTIQMNPGKRIQLVFTEMRLEIHPNCSYDYLQILDGLDERAHQLAIFCNTSLPPPIMSSGPYLTLRFHSDESQSDKGFHVAYAEAPGVPGCGGVLTSSVGIVSSPHHPEPYAHELDCEWLIRLPPLETISLEFLFFEIENANNCRYDYVEIREGSDPNGYLVGRYCGRNIPQPYRSVTNKLFIRFHSDESVAYGGFRIKYEAACGGTYTSESIIRSPYYPGSYPNNRDCTFIISQPVGKAIRLDFIDFDIESAVDTRCLFDFLEIRDGDNENSTLIGHYCGANGPESILSSLNYLWLRFKTDGSVQNRGFMANFSAIDLGCGGIIKGNRMGVIQSPGHPEVYPTGVNCKWIIRGEPGEIIRITWATFTLETHSRCSYDYVEIFDNSTMYDVGHSMGRFCGDTLPPTMTSSDFTLTINFQSDHSIAHEGFMASYAILNASNSCGGNYLTQYGTIKSPGFPNRYPNRKMCVWTIKVPAGQQIRLNITDFDLENGTSRGCIYDYLEIRNGGQETSPLIGKFCNNQRPPSIIPSFTNALYFKFYSDISRTFQGFKLEWDGTTTGCGGSLTGSPQGSITSPNYPQHYGIRTECIWTITINPGSLIQLTFVDLDIQNNPTCYGEHVELRDGITRNGKLLGKYCYSETAVVINSTSNSLRLKYFSYFGGNGRGFRATYRTICNRVIQGFGSVIESPNFPRPYPHNRNCTWEIRATLGNMVNLSFSHFSVEGPRRNNCTYDFVELSERAYAKPEETRTIGRYCGENAPSLVSSTKDTVLVNFQSDSSLAFNGFRLEWVISGCGGRLLGPWGYLHSPNYPRHYPISVQCIWHITTEIGTNVQLYVWDLDIEQADNCGFDYLRVYGGSDENSAVLLEICHKMSSQIQTVSHGNNMYVIFHSDYTVAGRGFAASYSQVSGRCGGRFNSPQGTINSPNWPAHYDNNDDCSWIITVDPNHVVQLQFTEFAVESHSNCSYDHVAVYDGRTTSSPQLLMHCGMSLPNPPIIKATTNQLLVKLKTDNNTPAKGFSAKYSTACGARLTNRYGQISTIETSKFLLTSTNCTWIIVGATENDHVTLTFTFMDIHAYNADSTECNWNYVEVLDGEDELAPVVGRYCFGTIPPALTSRGNAFVVRYKASGGSGHGFRANYEISSSACGGDLVSMQGSFTSPNYPNGYPMSAECTWNVRASPGNRVQLSFRRMDIESSDFCNRDFVEIHENSATGRLLGHYCGNEIPANVTAANNLWILFRSDEEGQAPGFWADYTLSHGNELNGTSGDIASPLWPNPASYSGTFYWRVTVEEGMLIQIQFSQFEAGYNSLDTLSCARRTSEFKIFDGYDTTAPVLLSRCDQILPDPVTSSGNVLYIVLRKQNTFANVNFKLRWTAIPPSDIITTLSSNITGCGGNFTISPGNSSILTSPNYPLGYPDNMLCEWFFFTDQHYRLKVKVESLDMESHWSCLYDKVEIYDGKFGETNYELNSTLCQRSQVGNVYYSSGRTIKIVMRTDSSQSAPGFNFTLSTECGGFIKTSKGELGRIASPNFGVSNYAHSNCTWFVMVRPGRTIRITFTDMDIYASSQGSCSTDTLTLRNGGQVESPFLGQGRFCGQRIPDVLETDANQLYVKFLAYTAGGRGFAFNYNEISGSCGGQIHLTHDVREYAFSSPNFPTFPPPFTECEWIFTAPQHEAVQIDFQLSFDITTSRACERAGVEIRDGGTRLSPAINTFCSQMPGTQKSTGNNLYLRYYTSVPDPRTGFKAKASIARCGGTLVGWRGTIVSNGYPTSYDINLDCMWTIKGPEGSYLILDFIDLELNAVSRPTGSITTSSSSSSSVTTISNCTQDRVIITEENISGIENPRNWTFCERSNGYLPSRVETSTNQIHIRFVTDNQRETSKGFKLYYRAANERCGGTLTQPSGIIQSPGYPVGYSHYRSCYWTIRAPLGRRIRLEFLDFDLEEKILTSTIQYCVDFVSLRQSQDNGFPYRRNMREFLYNGSLCGSQLPPPVETTSSTLYMVFRTDNSIAHRGFKARYTTDYPIVCGGTIDDGVSFGNLASPTEMTNTPNTTTTTLCTWTKTGDGNNGTTIITLNSVFLPQIGQSETSTSSVPCTAGGFLRFSPPSQWAYAWKKFCGSITNQKFYVPGSTFTTSYQGYSAASYFNMTYQIAPCGGTVSGPMSNITTPNYPSAYPANMECIWVLDNLMYGSQIKLIFADLDLDDSRNPESTCDKDYVVVRNGKYPTSPLMGTYCGNNIPSPIISMSRSLWIEFHSDGETNGNRRGFRIESQSIARGCGGVLHVKYGALSSPRINARTTSLITSNNVSPKYPHNTECEWIIETVPGYVLNLQFNGRFDIENSTNCTNDYVQLFTFTSKSEWKSLGKFCGKQIPSSVNTTSTKAKVLFHSNDAINGDGFRLNWYSPCGGFYTNAQGEIRSAHYDRYNHSLSVHNYGHWSPIGWERTYRVQKCDYTIQGSSPDTYIIIEFLDPFQVSTPMANEVEVDPLAAAEIRCPTVNVTIWAGNNSSNSSSIRRYGGLYCGEQVPPAFVAQGGVTISYNYLANYENYGFRLRYSAYNCGGVITEPTTLRSPGHPFTSAPNMNCTWIVKAPSNKVVRLKFESLDLEFHPNCQYDAVLLFDGPLINDEKKLGTYCGNLTNDLRRIISISDSVTVQFVTDWSIQRSGFVVAIDFTLGHSQNCGGIFNISSSGPRTITSPDGDNDGKYDFDLSCDYIIIGADYQMIELSFSSFNLESATRPGGSSTDDPCPYDYFEVKDGPGPYSESLGKFCSNSVPPSIVSSTNFMWFSFVTDGSYNFPGFRVVVTSRPSVCGISFALNATTTSQFLTSPNYGNGNTYGNNLRCRWIIEGSSSSDEVDVKFNDLDIESSVDCTNDRLQIRDVSSSYTSKEGISGPLIFNGVRARDWRFSNIDIDTATIMQDMLYCGTQIPPDFFSVGRSVEVVFQTNAARVARGFKIEYRAAGCNRTYTNVQGRIFSPEWPTYSPMSSNCFFTVNAPNGSFVSLYFNEFLLPESTGCIEGAFEARENNQNGRLLGRYCGSAVPNPIFSSTSTIWVQYFTRYQLSRGYDLTYTSSNGIGCGGDIFHIRGSFTSPYYPSNYSSSAACTWRIRVPAALKLQFDFTTFMIAGNCDSNFLEISSMNSHTLNEDPVLMTRYCGGDTPARYLGTTDMAMIRYKSSVNNTGNGWRIVFRGTT